MSDLERSRNSDHKNTFWKIEARAVSALGTDRYPPYVGDRQSNSI